jgi:hypothetical protein
MLFMRPGHKQARNFRFLACFGLGIFFESVFCLSCLLRLLFGQRHFKTTIKGRGLSGGGQPRIRKDTARPGIMNGLTAEEFLFLLGHRPLE